jgi:hypothetical protein
MQKKNVLGALVIAMLAFSVIFTGCQVDSSTSGDVLAGGYGPGPDGPELVEIDLGELIEAESGIGWDDFVKIADIKTFGDLYAKVSTLNPNPFEGLSFDDTFGLCYKDAAGINPIEEGTLIRDKIYAPEGWA